mmetsp:Transcript_4893/g.4146  ORF Transcript_4893/g.4146 Transcript_4893/m.4146 type:complete len:237 (+) Transcript_4893:168-878(+)
MITEDNVEQIVYNDEILDYRSKLKNLPERELDLILKTFGDSLVGTGTYSREEIMSCSLKMGSVSNFDLDRNSTIDYADTSISESSESFNNDLIISRSSTIDKERLTKDFLFNELSAKKLQEWHIIKINNKGKKQNRILGIDAYYVYNDKVSNRKKSKKYKFIKKMFKSNDAKRTSRPLDSIQYIQRVDYKTLIIKFKEEGKDKNITYECPAIDICSEILAKLKYLGKEVKDVEEDK